MISYPVSNRISDMVRRHILLISLSSVFVLLLFAEAITPRVNVQDRVVASPCCNGSCCCPPGQCKCCENEPEAEKSDTHISDDKRDSRKTSFWRSLACAGHATKLFGIEQDPYIFGFGPPTLFDDISSKQEGPIIPMIRKTFIPPLDKIPKLPS